MTIEVDMDESSELFRETKPKARKEHKCGECYRTIEKGERYNRYSVMYEGDFSEHKMCKDCNSVAESYFNAFIFGEVWEYVRNEIDECYGDFAIEDGLTETAAVKIEKLVLLYQVENNEIEEEYSYEAIFDLDEEEWRVTVKEFPSLSVFDEDKKHALHIKKGVVYDALLHLAENNIEFPTPKDKKERDLND